MVGVGHVLSYVVAANSLKNSEGWMVGWMAVCGQRSSSVRLPLKASYASQNRSSVLLAGFCETLPLQRVAPSRAASQCAGVCQRVSVWRCRWLGGFFTALSAASHARAVA